MNLSLILTAFLFGIMLALAYGRGRFLKLFSFDFFFFRVGCGFIICLVNVTGLKNLLVLNTVLT